MTGWLHQGARCYVCARCGERLEGVSPDEACRTKCPRCRPEREETREEPKPSLMGLYLGVAR